MSEQEFQFEALVSEGSAIRLGRLLGEDTILLYRTDGATLIDRFLACYYHAVPPFVIMSKMMNVESAEMIFHNVVTSLVNDSAPRYWRCLLSSLAPHHKIPGNGDGRSGRANRRESGVGIDVE